MPRFDLSFRNKVDWAVAGDRNSDAPLSRQEVVSLAKREMYAIKWGDGAVEVGGIAAQAPVSLGDLAQ